MNKLAPLPLLLLLAGCSNQEQAPAAAVQTPDCTKIASAVERLGCFDAVARTPGNIPGSAASTAAPAPATTVASENSPIIALVQRNEADRKGENHQFLLSRSTASDPGGAQMVISAPALGSDAPRPLLAISCLSRITRLQLLTGKAIPDNRVRIRLLLDDKPVTDTALWQVLDVGNIVDAGRGLVAIDVPKRLGNGSRLQTESDYPPLDGLIFDASGLQELIAQQREACHW